MYLFLRPYGPVCTCQNGHAMPLVYWFFLPFLHINEGKTLNYTRYTQFVKKRISNKIEAKQFKINTFIYIAPLFYLSD